MASGVRPIRGGIELEGETSHSELLGVIPAILRLQRGAYVRHRKSRQPLGFDTENPLKKILGRAPRVVSFENVPSGGGGVPADHRAVPTALKKVLGSG